MDFRTALYVLIALEAKPLDKFGHQPRLYALTTQVGEGQHYDDDVVYAAAWLHDLGVFIGHRPEDPEALARWDHVLYTVDRAPFFLAQAGFPQEKVAAVLDAIRTHQPQDKPSTLEGVILRDADILEQLGAIGIMRTLAKVGRDGRFPTFTPAVAVLRRNLEKLPGELRLDRARVLAEPKIRLLEAFLSAAAREAVPDLF
ncbi:MAG TPA: HD domain-containing protein [Bryobacteraceae bacterium]